MTQPPDHIVLAAMLVSHWFEENNIHTWAIGNCKNRWQRAAIPSSADPRLEVPQDWALEPIDGKARP